MPSVNPPSLSPSEQALAIQQAVERITEQRIAEIIWTMREEREANEKELPAAAEDSKWHVMSGFVLLKNKKLRLWPWKKNCEPLTMNWRLRSKRRSLQKQQDSRSKLPHKGLSVERSP